MASSSSSLSPLESLRSILSSLPPPSRPSLLSRILDHLLALTANSLPNTSHLFLGETSSRQAERIISGTALGRGWALPLELAASYKLPTFEAGADQIMQLKPLKDITIREAAIWCHNARLPTMNSRGWGGVKAKDDGKRDARGKGGVASLEMLTERESNTVGVWLILEFIAGLSVTHPSTVSTINRTGEKLVFPGDADKTLCPVCEQYVSLPISSHFARYLRSAPSTHLRSTGKSAQRSCLSLRRMWNPHLPWPTWPLRVSPLYCATRVLQPLPRPA
jgi:cytoplasmic tRNA 2-thiolation protein 2